MPKSKRDRKVTLSKTEKKAGLEFKQDLVEKIRNCVNDYARIFVFSVDNMRNNHLKDIREKWNKSKFYLGKNRVMSLALGRTPEEEIFGNLHKVSGLLRTQCGLLFTNETKEGVLDFFENHTQPDFARSGAKAEDTLILTQGPLEQFSFSMEPQLRALGMPTALKKGVIHLISDYTVCTEGQTLSTEQARILKLLGHQSAKFKLNMIAVWNKKEEIFELLRELKDSSSDDEPPPDDVME